MGAGWLLAAMAAWAAGQSSRTDSTGADDPTIVITGERVPRPLSQTASSVDVVTAEELETLAAPIDVDQILANIPNVQLGSGGAGPTIRGQDTNGVLRDLPAFLGGNRPRATVQVDGRALNYFEFVFGTAPLWDVEQIEVFRTPQSTTQGRNSIGGAIFVETQDPTWAWEGRLRGLGGSFDTGQVSAVLSGPILPDQLAVRVAADLFRQRPSSDIGDNMRGADPDRDRHGLVRAKLLFEPNAVPDLRVETSYVHLESQSPQIEGVEAPFEERADPNAGYGIFRVRSDSLTGRLNYAFSPNLSSATTLSWGDTFIRRFAPPGRGESRTTNRDRSVESILRWSPDGPAQLSGGLHHFHATLDQQIDLTAVPFIRAVGTFDDVQTSLGLFGEASLRPSPRVTVTAGLRHQLDRQDREGVAGPFRLDYRRGFSAWLPKLSVAYAVAPNSSIGLLVQRAFNPGGVTIDFFSGEADTFDAETLWNVEAFSRLSLAGGRLHLEANLFANFISDAQRVLVEEIRLPDGTRDFTFAFANAHRARSHGAELQIDWRPSPRLRLSGGVGLLRTRIVETDEPEFIDPADRLEGKAFARAPEFTSFASVEWRPIHPLSLSAQLRHGSSYFSEDSNYPELRIRGSTVIDSRASWRWEQVTFFAYARNLLGLFYFTELGAPDFGTLGDPRELGIGLDFRF